MRFSNVFLATGLVLGVLVNPADAFYLDPTTGSIAFQAAIGGLLAAAATVRIHWRRIQSVWRYLPGRRRSGP